MKKTFLFSTICILNFISATFSQNVGMGTETPTRARLEVNGAVDATSAIFGGESSGISLQRNWPGIGFNSYYSGGDRTLATGYGSKLYLDPNSGYLFLDMLPYTGGGDVATPGRRTLSIAPSGYIGLMGAPANAQLQLPNVIDNRKLVLWEAANNDHQFFGFGIEAGALTYNVGGGGDVHKFYCGDGVSASTTLMTIGGDKRVLIGTQAGGAFVGINSANSTHTLSLRQAASTGLYMEEAASGANFELYVSPIQATTFPTFRLNCNGTWIGYFKGTGEYMGGSDRRLKTNIEDMPSLMEKVMQLKPKLYEMKANNPTHEQSVGFIAQEVQPLFPQLVSVTSDEREKAKGLDNLYAMNYAGFGVIAVKAIQEQQLEIQDLKKEMNILKEQNKMLFELLHTKTK